MSDKKYYYKLFRVKKLNNDKSEVTSTISMDPVLVTKAIRCLGGLSQVDSFVKEQAMTWRDSSGITCSAYVAKKIQEKIVQREKSLS